MGTKLLIIDDSKFNIELLTDILKKEAYDVYSCENSLMAIEAVQDIVPDAILLDIVMPGIDGFEVCRLLKEKENVKDIPVIMISSKTDSNDLKKALDLGAFDYIKKPIDEIEVIARVKSSIRFKIQQDKLKERSMRDGLTELYNHTSLMELFKRELKRCEAKNKHISFVMIDIDFFKKVNDTYGHICGDMVLKEISAILSGTVRKCDIVGRYGGEEFSIVFPDVDLNWVMQLCEIIRKTIENHEINICNDSIKVTVSVGICYKASQQIIADIEMIKVADKAVYKAKREGRNRIELGK